MKSWNDIKPGPALRLPKSARKARKRRRLEASIEEDCRKLAQSLGWLSRKMNGLGFRDWPDRLFLPKERAKRSRAFWVEFKRPGEEPTPSQARMHRTLKLRGESVYVCRTKEEFAKILDRHNST